MKKTLLISLLLNYYIIAVAIPKVISPKDYGLNDAKNGVERYYVLLRCHKDALSKGYGVSYKSIKEIDIEIPKSPESIPLSSYTDFANVEMRVTNNQKMMFLYSLKKKMETIKIAPKDIDKGEFSSYSEINNGTYLVVIEDEKYWSDRLNYENLEAYRKDVMLIKKGKTKCRPVLSYNSSSTKCMTKYCQVDNSKKVIKNLKFIRTPQSTNKTFLLSIENEYKIVLSNISIITPDNDKEYADFAIHIQNCVDLSLNDISIYGTYSLPRKVGYGVYLNNIYNLKVNRMYARSNWGVFGTHNLQKVILKDCDINRFDIHCYGRDVKAVRCKFSNLYNQFSSVFGTISFEKCEFTNFIPFLIESSYNAYTPFDVKWKDCTFNLDDKHNYIMTLFGVPEQYNERPELRRKCLPNISITNCKVKLADNMNKWYLIHTGGVKYKDTFDYISEITLKGVKVYNNKGKDFELSTEKLKYTNPVKTDIKLKCVK